MDRIDRYLSSAGTLFDIGQISLAHLSMSQISIINRNPFGDTGPMLKSCSACLRLSVHRCLIKSVSMTRNVKLKKNEKNVTLMKRSNRGLTIRDI